MKDLLFFFLFCGAIGFFVWFLVGVDRYASSLPSCPIVPYFIGKGNNEFIEGDYEVMENGCIKFNNRVACGKWTIEMRSKPDGGYCRADKKT